jgi:hypothetical protein
MRANSTMVELGEQTNSKRKVFVQQRTQRRQENIMPVTSYGEKLP